MNRTRAPFWVVDVVAMLLIGAGWLTNKMATDMFLVVLLAILGFGVSARVPASALPAANVPPVLPANDGQQPPSAGSGGIVGVVFAVLTMAKHAIN